VVWLGSYSVELLDVSDMQVDVQVLLIGHRSGFESLFEVFLWPVTMHDEETCSRQRVE
jgi:hypothetical protein